MHRFTRIISYWNEETETGTTEDTNLAGREKVSTVRSLGRMSPGTGGPSEVLRK